MTQSNELGEFRRICESVRYTRDARGNADGEVSTGRGMLLRMMSDGLRVTRTLTPDLWRSFNKVCERLSLPGEPYFFILNNPVANAMAMESDGQVIVTATSGLVKLVSTAELMFVLGHELGHYGLGHTRYHQELGVATDFATMQMAANQRSAEISADRVGMVVVQSLVTAAMVKVKMACGLGSQDVNLDAAAFVEQLRHARGQQEQEWQLYESHPSLPLRVLALLLFADSDAYLKVTGQQGNARTIADVDAEIDQWLEAAGSGHSLAAMRQEKNQRAVAWFAAVLGAEVQNPVIENAADELAGDDAAKARRFVENFGIEDGLQKLETVLREVSGSPSDDLEIQLNSICDAAGSASQDSRAVAAAKAINLL